MEIIKAIIIGIVEGITEWLPISSTGHMILVNEFVKLDVSRVFWEFFLVAVQLGAIAAVIVLFRDKIWPFNFKKGESFLKKDVCSIWLKVIAASVPAAAAGLFLDDWLEEKLYNYIAVAIALIVYGLWFIFLERKGKNAVHTINDLSEMDYRTALGIGFFQVLSLIPGTSRSGSTIIGAMTLGTGRPAAAEFTFWMAIPVMAGASLLKLLKFGFDFSSAELAILGAGCLAAFLVSMLAIKFIMNYVRSHDFRVFGWYRIILGTAVLAYFIFR